MAAKKKTGKSEDRWSVHRGSVAPEEPEAREAISLLQAYYYSSVRSHAKSIIDEIKSGDIKDREDLDQRLNEDADSSYWVTYTQWSWVALLVSDHDDAYEEEFGEKPEGLSQQTYAAFLRDLTDQVEAEADGDVDALFDREEGDED